MAPKTAERIPANLAELMLELGNAPMERILLQPAVGTATEADLVARLDGDHKCLSELVHGVLVQKTLGIKESMIASLLVYYLWTYLEANDLGVVFSADGPVRIRFGRIRMPDVCFLSWHRLPDPDVLDQEAVLDTAPELAVEVISKGNTKAEMEIKLDDYFQAGVQLVWYLYPKTQTVVVYTARDVKETLDKTSFLEGGDLLPGLRIPIQKLFTCAPPRKKKK